MRRVESPVFCGVHLGALLAEGVHDGARKLVRVGIAEHVPLPDDAPHPGQLHAHRLKPALAAPFEALLAGGDFAKQIVFGFQRQASVLPVPVGEEDSWDLPPRVFRAVQVAGDEKARCALEIGLFHGVFGEVDLAVNDGIQRHLRRHGPQPLRDENLAADVLGALVPLRFRFGNCEGEIAVEIFGEREAHVVRERAGGENPRNVCVSGRKRGKANEHESEVAFHGGAVPEQVEEAQFY